MTIALPDLEKAVSEAALEQLPALLESSSASIAWR
jgi:hypothetical protein